MSKKKPASSKSTANSNDDFITDLKSIVSTARNMSFRAANLMQVACNWLLGWRIVEQEQQGKARANYGKHVIKTASENLTAEFGKGFSVASLKSYRKFYLNFQDLRVFHALSVEFKKAIAAKGQALPALFRQIRFQISYSPIP